MLKLKVAALRIIGHSFALMPIDTDLLKKVISAITKYVTMSPLFYIKNGLSKYQLYDLAFYKLDPVHYPTSIQTLRDHEDDFDNKQELYEEYYSIATAMK